MEYFDKILHTYAFQHYLSTTILPYIHLSLWWTRLCWASVENLGSSSENAHNSWTVWYIHFKFCILMYFNIVQPLPCKTDEALPSIILAGDQFAFNTFLLTAETNLSTFNTDCALYCQLISVYIWQARFIITSLHPSNSGPQFASTDDTLHCLNMNTQ